MDTCLKQTISYPQTIAHEHPKNNYLMDIMNSKRLETDTGTVTHIQAN